MSSLPADFASFLRSAKLATYAALGDDATTQPLLADSKQLEFSHGPYLYRDIYFGLTRFVGQEVVYADGRARWSMAYSGGLCSGVPASEAPQVYRALRAALSAAPTDLPLRGPSQFEFAGLRYSCTPTGSLASFHGTEQLSRGATLVYELQFTGGLLA